MVKKQIADCGIVVWYDPSAQYEQALATVSGLVKILYPNGQLDKIQLEELLQIAMEGRRRVKEQLRRIGSFEFGEIEFTYRDSESGDERSVLVPEEADPTKA